MYIMENLDGFVRFPELGERGQGSQHCHELGHHGPDGGAALDQGEHWQLQRGSRQRLSHGARHRGHLRTLPHDFKINSARSVTGGLQYT